MTTDHSSPMKPGIDRPSAGDDTVLHQGAVTPGAPKTADGDWDSEGPPAPEGPDGASEASSGGSSEGGRHLMREVWREWIWPFLVVLLVVSTFRSAVADWNDVPTGSMKPTILPGERIFVNKVAYDLKIPFTRVRVAQWDDPRRGDVVVLFSPADGKRLVKRVIGEPGDLIEMRRNRLYVNGEVAAYEPYSEEGLEHLAFQAPPRTAVLSESVGEEKHPVLWLQYAPVGSTFAPLEVPEGHYFVMGDNRNQSRDSRWFGFVERESIVGQATAVVISIDWDEGGTPRWDRFFLGLP